MYVLQLLRPEDGHKLSQTVWISGSLTAALLALSPVGLYLGAARLSPARGIGGRCIARVACGPAVALVRSGTCSG